MQYDYLQQRNVLLVSQWEATLQVGHGIKVVIYNILIVKPIYVSRWIKKPRLNISLDDKGIYVTLSSLHFSDSIEVAIFLTSLLSRTIRSKVYLEYSDNIIIF